MTKAVGVANDMECWQTAKGGLVLKMKDGLKKISAEYDMKISIKKTKITRISRGNSYKCRYRWKGTRTSPQILLSMEEEDEQSLKQAPGQPWVPYEWLATSFS